jgi:hypothetical protein
VKKAAFLHVCQLSLTLQIKVAVMEWISKTEKSDNFIFKELWLWASTYRTSPSRITAKTLFISIDFMHFHAWVTSQVAFTRMILVKVDWFKE